MEFNPKPKFKKILCDLPVSVVHSSILEKVS